MPAQLVGYRAHTPTDRAPRAAAPATLSQPDPPVRDSRLRVADEAHPPHRSVPVAPARTHGWFRTFQTVVPPSGTLPGAGDCDPTSYGVRPADRTVDRVERCILPRLPRWCNHQQIPRGARTGFARPPAAGCSSSRSCCGVSADAQADSVILLRVASSDCRDAPGVPGVERAC